ncbi:hypothetical protein V8V91_08565 [Algoriphagus halophilus]|uniref:hypothetical protein n=1 Tax=Algoriphagus halophilus TaxID=226505 RepID=UPI00358E7877
MPFSAVKDHGNLPRRKEDDPFLAIWRHYHDVNTDIILTDLQKSRLEIYEFAWEQITMGFSNGEAAKAIQTHFLEKTEKKLSIRTCYNHIRDAIDLFGNVKEMPVSLEKKIFIETLKFGLKKCADQGEWKAWAQIAQTLGKTYDFNKETNEMADILRSLPPSEIVISSDPSVLWKEADELMEGVDFEDLTNETSEEEA